MKLSFLISRCSWAAALALAAALSCVPAELRIADTGGAVGFTPARTIVLAQYTCPNGRC